MSTAAIRRAIGKSPTDPELLEKFRRKAWVEQGVAVIWLDEVRDEWLRKGIENWAKGRFGDQQQSR